jgi:NADH dehydrogenase FAD-containing subunit
MGMVMTDARRVVVIGAGYAGLTAALGVAGRARRLRVGVTLVNRSARFTERLRLHQTASGQRLAELSIPAMVAGTGIEFVQGRVTAVDPEQRRVGLADGRELPYDVLVWALGSRADPGTVPGVVALTPSTTSSRPSGWPSDWTGWRTPRWWSRAPA